jgi:hypothetical protein
MNWLRRLYATGSADAMRSDLYNEATFYKQFIKDVLRANEEVIIECPFITKKRNSSFTCKRRTSQKISDD